MTGISKESFAFGPMFVGPAFALMLRRDDLIYDRATGTMEVQHRTMFGRKTRTLRS